MNLSKNKMQNSLTCWHCKKKLDCEKIAFQTSCDHCINDQHVCVNCEHYAPGKPNDCKVSHTEPVREKDRRNFCEDFKKKAKHSLNAKKKNSFFGEDPPKPKAFHDLFNN